MKIETVSGIIGTGLGVVGTAAQTNETLETISLIITIIGAIISFVVVPLLNWYRNAKKDGKIDRDEIADAADVLSEGIGKTADEIRKAEEKKGKNNAPKNQDRET